MAAIAPRVEYTPEDLLNLPDDGRSYELVGGQLVEKNVGGYADWVSGRILRLLGAFAEDQGLGWVLGETGYQCFSREPSKVRKPDVSFIRRGRLPGERIPAGHIPIAPDLAVEVVSPNDKAYEVDAKIEEYLEAEIPLIWEVNPEIRTVRVYHPAGAVEKLGENDQLTGGDVIPGFRCRVADLFVNPFAG